MSDVRALSSILSTRSSAQGPSWLQPSPKVETSSMFSRPAAPAATAPRVETPAPAPQPEIDVEAIVAEAAKVAEAKANAKVDAVLAKYAAAIENLEKARAEFLRPFHSDALTLALVVARGVVGQELAERPELILSAVKEAVTALGVDEPLRVRVGSQELEHLMENHPELFSKHIELVEDPKLPRGGCIAENAKRVVDASLSTRLEAIAKTLLHDLENT